MIGIRVAGVDPDGFDRIDRALNLADLWPACGMQQQFSAGIDTGQCGASFVTPTARTTSMCEAIVPKSFAVQRTSAKIAPGWNEAMRVRRLTIRSRIGWPKRSHSSLFPAIHVSESCGQVVRVVTPILQSLFAKRSGGMITPLWHFIHRSLMR